MSFSSAQVQLSVFEYGYIGTHALALWFCLLGCKVLVGVYTCLFLQSWSLLTATTNIIYKMVLLQFSEIGEDAW